MLNRRALLRNSAAGAAVLLLPQATARAAVLRDGRFRQGVLSGDPTPDGITLLTVLDDVEGKGSVALEVATDAAFRKVVARKSITTSAKDGWSVKARVTKLKPHERYYYRFETRARTRPWAGSRPRCPRTPTRRSGSHSSRARTTRTATTTPTS